MFKMSSSQAIPSRHIDTDYTKLTSSVPDDYLFKVYSWLSPLAGTFEKKQLDTFNIKGRQDGTGKWLLSTKEFNEWFHGTGKTLWCPGIRIDSVS